MRKKTKTISMISAMRLLTEAMLACLCFLTLSIGACTGKKVTVLPDSRVVHSIPDRHCLPCHYRYFDGRAVIDRGYLLDIFRLLKER